MWYLYTLYKLVKNRELNIQMTFENLTISSLAVATLKQKIKSFTTML